MGRLMNAKYINVVELYYVYIRYHATNTQNTVTLICVDIYSIYHLNTLYHFNKFRFYSIFYSNFNKFAMKYTRKLPKNMIDTVL